MALGAEAVVYHAAHPKYDTAKFENDKVYIEYPAAWGKPDYGVAKHREDEGFWVGTAGFPKPGFDTRWDTHHLVTLSVDFLGTKEIPGDDPKDALIKRYQKNHKRSFGADALTPPTLQPVRIAGMDGWEVTEPHREFGIDLIIDPWHPSPRHPLKALYNAFFGGEDMDKTALFKTKKGWCEIRWTVPGDKIARARYERIYGRILDSLKIKDA